MKNERFVLHAEVEGGEKVEAYEGTEVLEAVAFLADLKNILRLSCDLRVETDSGEVRTLCRNAKGDGVPALAADAVSWFEELDVDWTNEPVLHDTAFSEEEVVTIMVGDVGVINPKDLGL